MRGLVFAVFLAVIAPFSVTGCTALTGGSDRTSLTDANYKAAEMLQQQARSHVSQNTRIQVSALTDMGNPDELAPLGRLIAEQIGGRFVQLGYTVAPAGTDEAMLMREQAYETAQQNLPSYEPAAGGLQTPNAVITGQYARADRQVMVSLRMIDGGSGRLLAAYDYALPGDKDVRELAKPPSSGGWFFGF